MGIDNLLEVLRIDDLEKDIYKVLFNDGHMTAEDIAQHLGVSSDVAYESLKKMSKDGLIEEQDEDDVKKFHVKPSERLELLINQRQEKIDKAKDELDEMKK